MDNLQIPVSVIWESANSSEFKILESASEVDGVHILAKVSGPAFFPGTTSRNNVHYPIAAWEQAIADPKFRERLADRLVYGTIGHAATLDDNDIRDGKHSHIVTNVWIDESGVGQAEYLILNTGPGRNLNTSLRIRSKLRVSTRAGGFFEDKVGQNGVKSVIPTSFKLERIDFVIDPGYTDALPNLIESLNEDSDTKPLEGIIMTDKVVQILEARVDELKAEKLISESTATKLTLDIKAISESNIKASLELAQYQAIGTITAVQEAFATLTQYAAIGTVHQIHEAIEAGEETINDLTGTIDDIKAQLEDEPAAEGEATAEYKELGSPADVKAALTQALDLTAELQTYRDIGSVEEVQAAIDAATQMTQEAEEASTQSLVDSLGVPREVVDNLLSKGMSMEEISALVAQIKPTSTDPTEVTDPVDPSTEVTDPVDPVDPPTDPVDSPADPVVDEIDPEEKVVTQESMTTKLLRTRLRTPTKITESSKSAKPSLAARLMTTAK